MFTKNKLHLDDMKIINEKYPFSNRGEINGKKRTQQQGCKKAF